MNNNDDYEESFKRLKASADAILEHAAETKNLNDLEAYYVSVDIMDKQAMAIMQHLDGDLEVKERYSSLMINLKDFLSNRIMDVMKEAAQDD